MTTDRPSHRPDGPPPESTSPGFPTWGWWCLALVIGAYVVLARIVRLPGIGAGNDDATYFFLAKSLLHGSYRDLFSPGAPVHVQYPPGWPLLLALPVGLIGNRPEVLLLLPLALSAGGLLLVFDAARRVLPPVASLTVLAIAAFNPLVLTFGGRLMSEASFFFFAMLALWAFSVPEPSRRRLLVGAAAAIASAFMRSVGIAVIGAVGLHLILTRRWRWAAGFALAAALTFGPWLAWSFLSPDQVVGRSYAGDLARIESERAAAADRGVVVERVAGIAYRGGRYLFGHLHAVMGFKQASGTLADNIGWLVLLATAGVAGLLLLWKRQRLAVLMPALLFAVLFVWPWADRRFLHPLVAPMAFVLVAGAWALGRRVGRAGEWVAPLLLMALLSPGTVTTSSSLVRRGWGCDHRRNQFATCYGPAEAAYLEASTAARALPDSAIVMAQREAAFSYHSGRAGVYSEAASNASNDEFLSYLRSEGVTHVLISRVTRTEPLGLIERIADLCRRFELVREFGEGTELFRVLAVPAADSADTPTCEVARRRYEEARRMAEAERRNPDVFGLPRDDSEEPGDSSLLR